MEVVQGNPLQGGGVTPPYQPGTTITVAPPVKPAPIRVAAPVVKPKISTKTFYRNEGDATVYDNTGYAYHSREEFLAAGGSWDKVVVKPAIKVASNGFPTDLKVTNTPPTGTITKVVGAAPYPPSKSMVFGVGENLSKDQALQAFKTVGSSPVPFTPAQQAAENIKLFSETPTSQLLKQKFGDNLITKSLGFVMDQVDPLTRDLSNIHLIHTKISEGVANGSIDPSVFNGIEVLNKTFPQIIGDVGSAVLTAYTPSIGLGLLKESAGKELLTQGLKDLAVQGGKEGLSAGLQYGVTQALSSGSKNPDEITKIILSNAAIGATAGAVLHTAIPASVTGISKIIAANNAYKEAIINKYIEQGFSHEEAVAKMKLASQGGFINLFESPKVAAAKEAVANIQQNYEKELNKPNPNRTVVSRLKKAISQAEISRDQVIKSESLRRQAGFISLGGKEEPKPETKTAIGSKERGFITSVKEKGVQVEGTSGIRTRNTENLAIKARNLVKEDITTAEKLATGTSDKAIATTSELIKHYDNIAKTAKTTAEKNLALDKIAVIANETAKNLTDAGRTVQAASILNMQTPEGQLRFASRLIQQYNDMVDKKGTGLLGLRKKIPELTGQQAQDILNESKAVFGMPEGEAKAVAFQKLQNKISALIPSKAYDKVISVWKAGLLTGLKTTGTNVSANISHGLSEVIKDVPAAVVDKITSMFTGKRTLALTGKGSATGIAEGWKKGLRYLRTGYDERNLAQKLDYNKVNFTSRGGKILQKYEDGIFRLLGAEDQPFYYGAKARSLYSQAIAQAKNELKAFKKGVKPVEGVKVTPNAGATLAAMDQKIEPFDWANKTFNQRVDELVSNPTEDMLKYAVHDAEIAVFQNQTLLGKVAKGVQNIPGGQVIVPFGRTPAAVATQIVNYSPVGIVKTIVENIGKGKFDQRLFSQGIGRGITGTGALYIGMELFKHSRISLGFPQDAREKRLWELEGRKPNSILINGKWRSIAVLGPLGNILVVGGYLQNGLNQTGSIAQAMAQAGGGGFKSLTEQTFLQGLNSFTQAVNDPAGYGPALLGSLMGSVVPTIVSDVATATDPNQRRASATKDGLVTPLLARLPYFRTKLEPKINALGQPVKRAGNPIETMLDPTRPSRMQDGPVIKELRRLSDAGQMATPGSFADDNKLNLTPQEKTALQVKAGDIFSRKVRSLMDSSDYKAMSDEEKAKAIINFSDRSRTDAKVNYVQSQVEGLTGDALKAKLSELKKTGVLTKEVFTQSKISFSATSGQRKITDKAMNDLEDASFELISSNSQIAGSNNRKQALYMLNHPGKFSADDIKTANSILAKDTISQAPHKGFIGNIKSIVDNVVQSAKDRLPMFDNKWGHVLKQQVYSNYNLTPEIRKQLDKTTVVKENSSDQGAFLMANSSKAGGLNYNQDKNGTIKHKIELGNLAISTAAHELMHSVFDIKHVDPVAFNKAWEQAKKTDWDFQYTQEAADNILNNSPLYDPADKYSVANERYAYFGQAIGTGKISDIPEALQPFYQGVINK